MSIKKGAKMYFFFSMKKKLNGKKRKKKREKKSKWIFCYGREYWIKLLDGWEWDIWTVIAGKAVIMASSSPKRASSRRR